MNYAILPRLCYVKIKDIWCQVLGVALEAPVVLIDTAGVQSFTEYEAIKECDLLWPTHQ